MEHNKNIGCDMDLERLRAATDILEAWREVQDRPGNRGRSAGAVMGGAMVATAGTRLTLGAPGVDRCLESGLACGGLHEVRCELARDIGAGTGFALGLAALAADPARGRGGRIVWINDPAARVDGGGLFPAGLAQYGIDPAAMTLVEPRDLQEAMWAADEAAGCGGLAAMVFHIRGNPARFDITATRRLLLRARENGVLALVLRQSGQEEATAALTRWRAQTDVSGVDELDQRGVGAMRLSLTLERNRAGRTGQWLLAWNPKSRVFNHAASRSLPADAQSAHSLHRLHPSANRQDPSHAMGQVLDRRRDFGHAS
ncbi:ImuA family protein [Hoeflea sp.]|uniref:ImuA family protein n=1 Tax=Hoeflea sp. TaxID=1940281 RepID=UPI003B51A313